MSVRRRVAFTLAPMTNWAGMSSSVLAALIRKTGQHLGHERVERRANRQPERVWLRHPITARNRREGRVTVVRELDACHVARAHAQALVHLDQAAHIDAETRGARRRQHGVREVGTVVDEGTEG